MTRVPRENSRNSTAEKYASRVCYLYGIITGSVHLALQKEVFNKKGFKTLRTLTSILFLANKNAITEEYGIRSFMFAKVLEMQDFEWKVLCLLIAELNTCVRNLI